MTKENLEILEFEDKKTAGGKRYTRFKTSEGWMSCFDKVSCEKLKDFEGKTAKLEIMEVNGFKNIKKFLGEASDDEEVKKSPVREFVKNEFPLSMKVAYAKDLFISEMSRAKEVVEKGVVVELMKACCELVKIAEESFKEKPKKVEEENAEEDLPEDY